MSIDLHTHSTTSDGTMSPADLVKYAHKKGLSAIAITDHDTIDGIDEGVAAGLVVDSGVGAEAPAVLGQISRTMQAKDIRQFRHDGSARYLP